MSYFRRSDETPEGQQEDEVGYPEAEVGYPQDEVGYSQAEVGYPEDDVRYAADDGRPAGSRWGGIGERLVKVFTVQEPDETEQSVLEPAGETAEHEAAAPDETPASGTGGRFPVGPFGYSRSAVDQYVGELERELEDLRGARPEPAVSITEEIERLGEQTASILVVAHDQANETTRRAQEQADRCIADAAANAVSITAQAKGQLRELDSETDAVWQERRRLLDDVRGTAAALVALADDAAARFPEDDRPTIDVPVQFAE